MGILGINGLIIVLVTIILTMSLWSFWKIRRIHLKLFKIESDIRKLMWCIRSESVNISQQAQAVQELEWRLEVDRPLPPMRGWVASPDMLLCLVRGIKTERPGVILELGGGISTLVMALACRDLGKGRIVSVDSSEIFAERTKALLGNWGVSELVDQITAPIVEREVEGRQVRWYAETPLPETIDLLFIDGPTQDIGPMARWPAGPLLLDKIANGGAIYVDDANRKEEEEMLQDWCRRYPDLNSENLYLEKGGVVLRRPKS